MVRIQLPSLRDRPEDVRLLAHHFARQHNPDSHAIVTPDVEALLTAFHWPGNVRQLRNLVEQLAVLPEVEGRGVQGR